MMRSKNLHFVFVQPVRLASLLILAMLIITACQPAATSLAPLPTTAPVATQAVAFHEPAINVVIDPKLGQILVGDKGMTLYIFTKDEPGKSNCDASCLKKWPPLLTQGNPTLGQGVDASLVGTATLADGSRIVTYKQMPLYYWYKDTKPGDTTGQDVGQVWYVVSPAGQAVKQAVAAAEPPAPQAAAFQEPTINVVTDPKLDQILVGDKGMTLYIFTKDEPGKSNCDASCLKKWPPLLTRGNPTLGEGVDASLVGTATLADGSKIVTYKQMPLYYWYKDAKPGDTTGQDVGQVWYVVSPAGQAVKQAVAAAEPPAPQAAVFPEPTINVVTDPKLGQILVGDKGMTLYIFTKDEPGKSNCNADCLKKWPPLLTQGNPTLGEGVDASLVGTANLADGSKIVTYNQMPLYYWVKDLKPGDTTGEGVGNVWFVISPAGAMVSLPAPAPTSKPPTMEKEKSY
jgi:predicted lipoprotein with Yx(FWY)xxD motif